MGKVTGLAHIGVFVKDLEASVKFYTENLGFELDGIDDLGATRLAFVRNGGCILEFVCHSNYTNPNDHGIVDHVCLEVVGIEDVVAGLKAKGIAMEGEVGFSDKIRGGIKNIFFRGPDNERIELMEYVR